MVIKGVFDKINLYNQNKISQEKETPLKNKEKAPDLITTSDKVELSDQGKLLNNLIETAKKQDVVRQEKVNDLKDKVSSGEYKIDTKQIAKKLVENEIDLYL
ncbi:flagellar biosynthesis anti-sigma factor FlgM [Desulfothermus okinawensis]